MPCLSRNVLQTYIHSISYTPRVTRRDWSRNIPRVQAALHKDEQDEAAAERVGPQQNRVDAHEDLDERPNVVLEHAAETREEHNWIDFQSKISMRVFKGHILVKSDSTYPQAQHPERCGRTG